MKTLIILIIPFLLIGCIGLKPTKTVEYDDNKLVIAITQVDLNSTQRDIDLWNQIHPNTPNVLLQNRLYLLQKQLNEMRNVP